MRGILFKDLTNVYQSVCSRLLAEVLEQKTPAGLEPVKTRACGSHSASDSYRGLLCQMGPESEEPVSPLLLLMHLKELKTKTV